MMGEAARVDVESSRIRTVDRTATIVAARDDFVM
jgi:hypothetical protein